MRSQQRDAISGSAVTVLENVDDFQVYVCNPATIATSGCSWNNVQSTQGAAATVATPPVGAVSAVPVTSAQPNGIRILLKVPEGEITRERELPRFGGIPTT